LWWAKDGAVAHHSDMVMERLQQLLLAKPLNDNDVMDNRVKRPKTVITRPY